MSTRCMIAYERDGTIRASYCHHDGNLQGVGRILLDHCPMEEKVAELIDLGHLSSLGENIGPEIPVKDENGFQEKPVTVAYVRDMGRGDDFMEPEFYENKDDLYRTVHDAYHNRFGLVYLIYFYQDGQWFYCEADASERWDLLSERIATIDSRRLNGK